MSAVTSSRIHSGPRLATPAPQYRQVDWLVASTGGAAIRARSGKSLALMTAATRRTAKEYPEGAHRGLRCRRGRFTNPNTEAVIRGFALHGRYSDLTAKIGRPRGSATPLPLRPGLPAPEEPLRHVRPHHVPLTILLGIPDSTDDRGGPLAEGDRIERRIVLLQGAEVRCLECTLPYTVNSSGGNIFRNSSGKFSRM